MMFRQGRWTVRVESDDTYTIGHDSGVTFAYAYSTIATELGLLRSQAGTGDCTETDSCLSLTYRFPGSISLRLGFQVTDEAGWLLVSSVLANESARLIRLEDAVVLDSPSFHAGEAFDRVLRHGKDLCDFTSLHRLEERCVSHECCGLTHSRGTHAAVLGFGRLDRAFCRIELTPGPEGVHAVKAVCPWDGVSILPGQSLELPSLLLGIGQSLSGLMHEYARQVADTMGARVRPVETGWCSWYYYYGTETEEDIFANVASLRQSPLGDTLRVVQIDDGWNLPTCPGEHLHYKSDEACTPSTLSVLADPPKSDHPRVWGDWIPGGKFPSGMRRVSDRIREAGFVSGLWLAPFSVDHASALRREHPNWLVQGDDGPADFWGVHALDLTHPEALAFVHDTFVRVFDEWGFDYVKIDFLLHAVQPGRRHDSNVTLAQAFREALRIIRNVAKDRFVLVCGSPMGPAVGLCDGMRIGYDVSSRWWVPMNLGAWPSGNCNIRAAAIHTFWRQWMHQVWWQNDPDCLVVRDRASEPEVAMFRALGNGELADTCFGLSDEEASCWVRLVWMTGGMRLLSENLDDLNPNRRALLEKAFDAPAPLGRWVDWYENPEVLLLRCEANPLMIGLFNVSDTPAVVIVPRERLGVARTWRFTEWLIDEAFEGAGESVHFPVLPAHGGRIWRLSA